MKQSVCDPFNVRNAPRRSDREMVRITAYLPVNVAEEFALLALVKDLSRAALLTKAISGVLTKNKMPMVTLIEEAARRIKLKWEFIANTMTWDSDKQPQKEFLLYLEEVREILKKRGLNDTVIAEILKRSDGR